MLDVSLRIVGSSLEKSMQIFTLSVVVTILRISISISI